MLPSLCAWPLLLRSLFCLLLWHQGKRAPVFSGRGWESEQESSSSKEKRLLDCPPPRAAAVARPIVAVFFFALDRLPDYHLRLPFNSPPQKQQQLLLPPAPLHRRKLPHVPGRGTCGKEKERKRKRERKDKKQFGRAPSKIPLCFFRPRHPFFTHHPLSLCLFSLSLSLSLSPHPHLSIIIPRSRNPPSPSPPAPCPPCRA